MKTKTLISVFFAFVITILCFSCSDKKSDIRLAQGETKSLAPEVAPIEGSFVKTKDYPDTFYYDKEAGRVYVQNKFYADTVQWPDGEKAILLKNVEFSPAKLPSKLPKLTADVKGITHISAKDIADLQVNLDPNGSYSIIIEANDIIEEKLGSLFSCTGIGLNSIDNIIHLNQTFGSYKVSLLDFVSYKDVTKETYPILADMVDYQNAKKLQNCKVTWYELKSDETIIDGYYDTDIKRNLVSSGSFEFPLLTPRMIISNISSSGANKLYVKVEVNGHHIDLITNTKKS